MKPEKKNSKINPKLKPGDNIILLHMEGESMSPGLKGVVNRVEKDPFESADERQIYVNWENGRQLALLSSTDLWMLDTKKIDESTNHDKFFMENVDLIKHFNTKLLVEYLTKVRDSGITNMFGASQYLWMGKERLEHEFKYRDVPNEEMFEEVLDMANQVQSIMINGTISMMNEKGIELDLDKINSLLMKNSNKILNWYMHVLS